jgi:hypothetical protein
MAWSKGTCTALLVVVAVASVVRAQSWTFTRIADAGSIIPGTSAPFEQFGPPTVEQATVGFWGRRTTTQPAAGVFRGSGGPLSVVADNNTSIPGGTGNFTAFGTVEGFAPSLFGPDTAFIGDGLGASFIQRGIYLRSGTGLIRVVDRNTPVPAGTGGNFFNIRAPALHDDQIAFVAWEFGNVHRGVYRWQSGVTSVVANTSIPIPAGSGTFVDFLDNALDNHRVVFTAVGTGGQCGIYAYQSGGPVTMLYNQQTPVPGSPPGSIFSLMANVAADDGRVAFFGRSTGQEGVYTDMTGPLTLVANHSTPVPGRPGQNFNFFGFLDLDGDCVAFTGVFGGGNRGVYVRCGGVLSKVLAQGDPLDGRTVFDITMGPQGLSGDNIAIWVEFTNGTFGVYRATRNGCYPDCDGDGRLTLADFGCFQTRFGLGYPWADCDGDGIRSLADFRCFVTKFALGCP